MDERREARDRLVDRLRRAGYGDVSVVVGDGSRGLPGGAPYDRINVTCAAPDVPAPLLDQLDREGRMTIPLGETPRGSHTLYLVERRDGRIDRAARGPVRSCRWWGRTGSRRPSEREPEPP